MRVLITGGAGYFGKAMTQRLLADNLSDRICIYSRDEAKQARMRTEFNDGRIRYFVGDIRDASRLERAMSEIDIVIHAAALKRIEVGYYNPDEMVKTNILGSQNVVDACLSTGSKAVLLSTDKACEPISPYGYTKALAESIFLSAGPGFAVTRYGNVMNSTGSVIPIWKSLIDSGETSVPVTDPEATRFWMFADEAVDLVLDTIREMPASPAVPDLPAFSLGDLATAMGAEYHVTGLPHWEKKHESMLPGMPSNEAKRLSVEEIRERLSILL